MTMTAAELNKIVIAALEEATGENVSDAEVSGFPGYVFIHGSIHVPTIAEHILKYATVVQREGAADPLAMG
jgi:hypothetical protein